MTDIDNTSPALSDKQILADPVGVFVRLYPDGRDVENAQLQLLQQQHNDLKKRQKELQLQSKKISRQIGQAKRDNQSIDDLKSTMQLLSQQLKDCTQRRQKTGKQILSYFRNISLETGTDKAETGTMEFNYGIRDYDETVNIDKINICQLTELPAAWNEYVNQHPAGCIHHRSEWLKLFHDSYRHPCFCFAAFDDDKNIVGILPLVRLKSRLFGDLLVSMPFFQRGGAIADHPQIEHRLMSYANGQAEKFGIEHIEYRDDITRKNMPVQSHKVNMVLALPDNKTALWQSFSSKLRAQINRPKREAPQVLFGHTELIDDFYAVYARNMRDLGSPLHSKQFILNILQQFPENSWLAVVRLENKPVAGAFLLAYKDTMEIPLASTIRDVNHLSINMLLYWQVLKFAISKAYKNFDFGRSTKDTGTYRFKKQWGAKAKPLYWHYWLKDGAELPELNPSNPKYALVIFLWKRLPVKLSQLLGPHIVKYIP